jgi:hypothetical protein
MLTSKNTASDKVFAEAGLNGFDLTFARGSTIVLRLNFCVNIPGFWQHPKPKGPANKLQHDR